tara:strand:+ start:125 stop:835 length:711 start_codon:yes stop_codon:yes gene_type:complete
MKKPIIGITLDSEDPGEYSKFPWYALRKNYIHSIEKFSGVALPLAHNLDIIDSYLNIIDGLIITGGNYDIPPSLYGKEPTMELKEKMERTNFEMKICCESLKKDIPILGICGGEQVLNVCLGGTLFEDIKTNIPKSINHEQVEPRDKTSHSVIIESKSMLYDIIKENKIYVNSAHHQSVNKPGKNIKVCGIAEDGVIEAIESNQYKWCLGVQWHPEFLITKADNLIIESFIKFSSL